MQSRAEKAGKSQMRAVTTKEGTSKQQGKTHPKIAATQPETVDTGVSTGSMKT